MSAKRSKSSWHPTISDFIAIAAFVVSILVGIVNYCHSSKAIELSSKALESQGPNISLAEEKMNKNNLEEYAFIFPFKNHGERSTKNFKITMYIIGQDQNEFVIFHSKHEFSNELPPNVIRSLSGSLVTNPNPQFIVFDLDYEDALVDKKINQRLFYSVSEYISQLADPQLKESLEKILP